MCEFTKDEFYDWYRRCEHILKYRDLENVLSLAYWCGFRVGDNAPEVARWIQKSRRLATLWESPFFENWVRVQVWQRVGECDEV